MIRGLYTAASGMMASLIANDTLANNLANVNTTGFKKNEVNFQTFPEMLISKMSNQGSGQVGTISTGSKVQQTYIDFSQGALIETGNTFDLSLEGEGFFTVKTAHNETYYTRAGNFTMDNDGYLTTVNGDYVQGKLGRINMRQDEPPYAISRNGDISGKGRVIDRLVITRFENPQSLQKVGDARFEETAASEKMPEPANGVPLTYKTIQGTLERANTNVVGEMVNSITGMRLYEALQKNIHMQNETLQKAVNEVGRYR